MISPHLHPSSHPHTLPSHTTSPLHQTTTFQLHPFHTQSSDTPTFPGHVTLTPDHVIHQVGHVMSPHCHVTCKINHHSNNSHNNYFIPTSSCPVGRQQFSGQELKPSAGVLRGDDEMLSGRGLCLRPHPPKALWLHPAVYCRWQFDKGTTSL